MTSLARGTLGRLAAHAASPTTDVTTAFSAGDWEGQNLGSGGPSVSGGNLVVAKNGVSGIHFCRYTPVSAAGEVLVLVDQASQSTGGTARAAARLPTGTATPDEAVYTGVPVGFSSSYSLTDRTGGASDGSSSTGSGSNRTAGSRIRMALWVKADASAAARLISAAGSGTADASLTLTDIDAAGSSAGVGNGSGGTGSLTWTVQGFAVLRSGTITVTGPVAATWGVRVKAADNSVLASSGAQSGGVATIDTFAAYTACYDGAVSLMTQIEVYDPASGDALAAPEVPAERVWGGDQWAFDPATVAFATETTFAGTAAPTVAFAAATELRAFGLRFADPTPPSVGAPRHWRRRTSRTAGLSDFTAAPLTTLAEERLVTFAGEYLETL